MMKRAAVLVTEAELRIDKYSLDEVVATHPELYFRVSEQYITALARRDYLKDELARLEAEVSVGLRADFKESDTKFTEASLRELVVLDQRVQEKAHLYAEARLETERAFALKEAFTQRGYALKELVTLYGAEYFLSDSERPSDPAIQQARKAMSSRLREKS